MAITTLNLEIGGMSCPHCVKAVQKALSKIQGLEILELGVGRARLVVPDPESTTDLVRTTIEKAGYTIIKEQGE